MTTKESNAVGSAVTPMEKTRTYMRLIGLIVLITFYITLTGTIILAFFMPNNIMVMNFNIYNEMGLELVLAVISIPFVIITISDYLNNF